MEDGSWSRPDPLTPTGREGPGPVREPFRKDHTRPTLTFMVIYELPLLPKLNRQSRNFYRVTDNTQNQRKRHPFCPKRSILASSQVVQK